MLREYEAALQLADMVCAMDDSDDEARFLRIAARVRCLVPPFDDVRDDNWTWVRGTVLYDLDGWLEVLSLMRDDFEKTYDVGARRYQTLRGKGGAAPKDGPDEWFETMLKLRDRGRNGAFAPLPPPNRTCGSPASGSPVSSLLRYGGS
jgi:hypothetical protein